MTASQPVSRDRVAEPLLEQEARRELASRSVSGLAIYPAAWLILGWAVSFQWPRPQLAWGLGAGILALALVIVLIAVTLSRM